MKYYYVLERAQNDGITVRGTGRLDPPSQPVSQSASQPGTKNNVGRSVRRRMMTSI